MRRGFSSTKNAPRPNVLDCGGNRAFDARGFTEWGEILQPVGGQICE